MLFASTFLTGDFFQKIEDMQYICRGRLQTSRQDRVVIAIHVRRMGIISVFKVHSYIHFLFGVGMLAGFGRLIFGLVIFWLCFGNCLWNGLGAGRAGHRLGGMRFFGLVERGIASLSGGCHTATRVRGRSSRRIPRRDLRARNGNARFPTFHIRGWNVVGAGRAFLLTEVPSGS